MIAVDGEPHILTGKADGYPYRSLADPDIASRGVLHVLSGDTGYNIGKRVVTETQHRPKLALLTSGAKVCWSCLCEGI